MDWIYSLSSWWLALVFLAATYLLTAAIYFCVMALATGRRAQAFTGVSPGMLPPMGLLFGLIVGFLVAQVWSDSSRAQAAVNREASALRSAVLLADDFPPDAEARIRTLVRSHIQTAVRDEWPKMESGDATLTVIPAALAQALQFTLNLTPRPRARRPHSARSSTRSRTLSTPAAS